ncbi:MAG: choice-of-anchor E domain-containing protein [Acidobacteria bacterium]|nr:choice-of-anchor E domain-containing protein [Acidobacteriota bacterium]
MAARLSSLFIVVSILLIPASVPVARASIVTEGPYTITPAKPGVDTIFAFDLFDSALGTLAGVSFDFNFQFRPGLQFFNTGDDAATFVNARVDVMGAGVRLFDGTLLDPGTLSYSLASGTAQPGTKTTFPDPVATPVQHSIQIPSGDFGAFLGPGTGTRTLVFSAPHYMVSADFASGNAEDVFVGGSHAHQRLCDSGLQLYPERLSGKHRRCR